MDIPDIDTLARHLGSRRRLLGGAAALATLVGTGEAAIGKRKRKKKVTICQDGQTLTVPAKKVKQRLKQGATKGACCVPKCSGCGGSDGCGGTCGCGSTQICDGGVCRACDVICTGDAIACGSELMQKLMDSTTLVVCPGRYQANLMLPSATLIGAGAGDDPATSTILDAGGQGRVVDLEENAVVSLRGLRITNGGTNGSGGGARVLSGSLKLTDCAVAGNTSTQGGGIGSSGTLRLTNTQIMENTAFSKGGGLEIFGSSPTFITNCVIALNTSGGAEGGGGIVSELSTLTIVGTEIRDNMAVGGVGGGLAITSGMATFNAACRIIDNEATAYGAIRNVSGLVNLNNATVSGNTDPQCQNVFGC